MKFRRFPRAAVAAMLLLLFLCPAPSTASVNTFTKTCVDQNGGLLCEGDWVRCTLHVEVGGGREDFLISDQIPGSFYSEWVSVQNPPPPSVYNGRNEGVPGSSTAIRRLPDGSRKDRGFAAHVSKDGRIVLVLGIFTWL